MPDSELTPMGPTQTPTDHQYRRAGVLLAHYTQDPAALRDVLEAIGYPRLDVTEPPPPPKPPPVGIQTRQSPVCRRGLHAMSGSNLIIDSGGRRCRECRLATKRRRAREAS